MKRKLCLQTLVGLGVLFGSTCLSHALIIDFSEVAFETTDPLIAGVQFSAGNPVLFEDTYTDDFWSSGNPYLANGIDSTGTYDTFIKAEMTGPDLFTAVLFNIQAESFLPDGNTFYAEALSGGSVVDTASLFISDYDYHSLSVSVATGFDSLVIYSALDENCYGDFFHIDNFDFTTGDVAPIPEPATMLLMGTGLTGLFAARRKQKKA